MLRDSAMLGAMTVGFIVKTTTRIPKLPTDRHFLELSDMCLYMVHLGLGIFFRKLQK